MTSVKKPLVGVICDRKIIDPHPFHVAGEKYLLALKDAANVTPVLIPAFGAESDLEEWMLHLDGLFLTGAYSMVQPSLYGAEQPEDMEVDNARDSTSFGAIKLALEHGIPLLGVCRGFQELVVATGGTLIQFIHEDARYQDHREDKTQSLDVQYGKAHSVTLVADSQLANICGQDEIQVNSLHVQGAETIGDLAVIEAIANDGLVEAISVKDSKAFTMAVQWHPEWKVLEDEPSRNIFTAFGDACRQKS